MGESMRIIKSTSYNTRGDNNDGIYETDDSGNEAPRTNNSLGRQTTVDTTRLSDTEATPVEISGNIKDMQEEIIALRKSQRQMESFQQQVLQEQKKIQEQLTALVKVHSNSNDTSVAIRAKSLMVSDSHHDR